jgi:hypothetical protein
LFTTSSSNAHPVKLKNRWIRSKTKETLRRNARRNRRRTLEESKRKKARSSLKSKKMETIKKLRMRQMTAVYSAKELENQRVLVGQDVLTRRL